MDAGRLPDLARMMQRFTPAASTAPTVSIVIPALASYDSLLTQAGIKHTTETPTPTSHAWNSGWVPQALAALEQDSVALGG